MEKNVRIYILRAFDKNMPDNNWLQYMIIHRVSPYIKFEESNKIP